MNILPLMIILYDYSSSNDDIVWSCLCEDRDSSKHLSISGVCLRISELHYFIDLTLKYPPRFPHFVQVTIANTTMDIIPYTHVQKYKNTQIHKTQITSPSTCCFSLCKWKWQILQLCIISLYNLDIQNYRKLDLILVQVKTTSTTILMCSRQLFLTFCQPS